MSPTALTNRVSQDARRTAVDALQAQGAAPFFRQVQSPIEATTTVDGRPRIMLASNNYLSLANHPQVVSAARAATTRFGAATLGSRLYSGTTDLHVELERELADWHGAADAVLFTTGYQTSVGTICGLIGAGDTVVVDSAIHASIQDGCRLSGAATRTFQHNDVDSLREQLQHVADRGGACLVVVEGLYSMEGDVPPLRSIAEACREYEASLMVDEAHSIGLFGADRTGLVSHYDVADLVEIRMGTFSKALASTGGFIAGSTELVDTLRVNARAFIFSMSAVPAAVASALAAVRIARSDEGAALAARAVANADHLRQLLSDRGITGGGVTPSESGTPLSGPIVSIELGEELAAVATWNRIFDADVFTGLSLFPAVPQGKALLRLSVMATHTEDQLDRVAAVVGAALQDHRTSEKSH